MAQGRAGAGRGRVAPRAVRIRGKLILLHTVFSLTLAAVLVASLRPAVNRLADRALVREAALAARTLAVDSGGEAMLEEMGVDWRRGDAREVGLSEEAARRAREAGGEPVLLDGDGPWLAAAWDERAGGLVVATVEGSVVEREVNAVYLLVTLAVLAVYGAIALTLEVFVLPRQVYAPIERLRRADAAVQAGERESELIPETEIPHDELGEIMRSRNESILKLRDQERALETALERLESVAMELKRKNHLLEAARRNLADRDRLASLGMMSAGIAHELNTPLAVLKGSVEELSERRGMPDPERVSLMLRVVRRLERLSESLLDFARVRESKRDRVVLREVVEEAWTLVSLDRQARSVRFRDGVEAGVAVVGDADRLTQVFVNLLRNGVDALEGGEPGAERALEVVCERFEEEGSGWARVLVRDNGPGLDPAVMERLFEPFASTRLDSRGTGLGLAVAEGIVKDHGGVLIARNVAAPGRGAEFEVVLPLCEGGGESGYHSGVGVGESGADDERQER